jgi:hypothetical protein
VPLSRPARTRVRGSTYTRRSTAARKDRPEGRGVDLYFSDYFGIPRRTIQTYGALDISLVGDLPLFIDPFLLFKSRKPAYRQLHDRIVKYLRFLRDRASDKDGDPALLKSWYTFPEVKQTWLGFSRSGNRGAGLGRDFAGALHGNLHTIFHNFGDEKITRSSHLEKLCRIKEGVGRDKISDFTTRLTLDFLCEYTERLTKRRVPRKLRKRFAVNRVKFNYNLERWMSKTYTLPHFQRDFVLLTPLDILTKDENWINRPGLFDEFEEIPNAIPDDALRAQVNNYFRKLLPRKPKKEDLTRAIDATIKQFPSLIDYYIRHSSSEGPLPSAACLLRPCVGTLLRHLTVDRPGKFPAPNLSRSGTDEGGRGNELALEPGRRSDSYLVPEGHNV